MEAKVITRVRPYLLNTPMSVFIGALLGIGFSYLLSGEFGDQWAKFYVIVLSSLLSLVIAGMALAGVLANIQAQEDRELEHRRRKRLAATAELPIVLTTICESFAAAAQASVDLATVPGLDRDDEFQEQALRDLTLPDSMILKLSNSIEVSESDDVANRIADLLAHYQIAHARWQGSTYGKPGAILKVNERRRTLEWVALYALSVSMFGYARKGEAISEITQSSLESAFAAIFSSRFVHLFEELEEFEDDDFNKAYKRLERNLRK
ncbi:hypothetical protein J7400_13330 [Shimia sp. R9_2]|uniref:hypothetical protein n=1 Tax=Shimia sp. R9_2 TaxID=2821112 RepID=UPI001ADA340F|nr:hypothetical protein [Shimia sp. R9_2]MBO9397664.1 hypothetical protein [Shimia sp. R9_2]